MYLCKFLSVKRADEVRARIILTRHTYKTYWYWTPGKVDTAVPRLDPSNNSRSFESDCWTWALNIDRSCNSKSSCLSACPRIPLQNRAIIG